MTLGLALLLVTAVGIPATPSEPVTTPPLALRQAMCRAGNLWAEEVEFAEDVLFAQGPRGLANASPWGGLSENSDPAQDAQGCELLSPSPVNQVSPAALHCEGPRPSRAPPGRCDMRRIGHPRARLHAGERHPSRGLLVFLPGSGRLTLRTASSPNPDERSGDRSLLAAASFVGPIRVPISATAESPLSATRPGYQSRLERPPR